MLKHIKFIDNHGSFCVNRPENTSYLYFPLASEAGLKSSVTPVLGYLPARTGQFRKSP